jgi:hypothetical protein
MFEKEAKQYGDNYVKSKYMETVDETWRKGAEFGYNKANEWHKVKDEKMPKFDEGTEIKFLKGKYTKAKRIVFCLCEDNDYQNIYAWKEIVLPELKESE